MKTIDLTIVEDMQTNEVPQSYEDLIRLIHSRHGDMSKAYQKIALFLTQNPNEVAVKSVNALADTCGIHPSSFVRFGQSLGFTGFKDLQSLFHKRLATAAPGFEARLHALEEEIDSNPTSHEKGFLRDLVVRDIASLQELLDSVSVDDISNAVEYLYKARTIYLVGHLRSTPVAELFHYLLTMLGKQCVLLNQAGGLATHVAKTIGNEDVLITTSFRFYATEVVNITEDAIKRGIPVVSITDSTLSPVAKNVSVLFTVPEHDYTFSRSLAAPMCIAQAVVVALAAKLQKNNREPRIPTVTSQK